MRRFVFLAAIAFAATALAQSVPELKPYSLPAKAEHGLTEIAGQAHVLVLGELHGTQEVPAVAAALLAPLSKLDYRVLALEVPADQQQPLIDWATGKTTKVPPFFGTKPIEMEDGRGNIQLLSMVRMALSPPFEWKLICFDEAWPAMAYSAKPPAEPAQEADLPAQGDGWIPMAVEHEKKMAARLVEQLAKVAPGAKVLAICGNMHARTSQDCRADSPHKFSADSPITKIWPSFAAAVPISDPALVVRSVRVEPHSGDYFAAVSTDKDPKPRTGVHTIRSKQQFQEAEARQLKEEYWDWQLELPKATAVTFLASNDQPEPAALPKNREAANSELRHELLDRAKNDQDARQTWIAWTKEHGSTISGTVAAANFTPEQKAEFEKIQLVTRIDGDNTKWLRDVIEVHGWPAISDVGADGAEAAWLLVQHAGDVKFQRKCLDLMNALPKGEVRGRDLAYLTDRVLLKEGKKQLYGTQFMAEEGKWKPQPIEDEANVDSRRAAVGLPPLAEYAKTLEEVYGAAAKAK